MHDNFTSSKGTFSCLRQFLVIESSLKLMKMPFISPQKLFSFSRYLKFCLDFLLMWKNGLIRKLRLFSKLMKSQPGKKTIATHILPNIFGQIIGYNIRNNFQEKSSKKYGEETIPRRFSKNSKLSIYLDQ